MESLRLTFAFELLRLHSCDLLAPHAARSFAPGAAGLDGVNFQVVSQPLKVAVTDEGVPSQMSVNK